jgi:Rac GTPase-activating protein 1
MKSEDAVPKEAPTLQTPTSTGPTKNTGDFIVDCTTATPVISSRRSATILRTPSTSILSPGKGLNHPHTFVEKTIVRMESCIPCGKRITFGKTASKCRDCKSICHLECRHLVPVPCIATTTQTPRGADKGALADYAPTERPQVPGIVVHCVNEVEARGLTEPGIYRVPGSDAMVKELLQRFLKGKGTPNLSRIEDINVICSLLKHFLRQLKEPVTTYGLWSSFIKAAENYRLGNLSQAVILVQETVARLPPPNRDTLAFLLLHLIRVAETKVTKMPVHNLAKVFGPTIIGYSSPEPEALQMLNEPRMQADVLELLMAGMGPAFWEGIVRADDPSWMSFNASNAETFNNTTLQRLVHRLSYCKVGL